jgi:hypothetical protein
LLLLQNPLRFYIIAPEFYISGTSAAGITAPPGAVYSLLFSGPGRRDGAALLAADPTPAHKGAMPENVDNALSLV